MKLTSLFCCSPNTATTHYDDYIAHAPHPHVANASNTSVVSTAKPPKAVKPAKTSVSEPEPYSAADANSLFGKYADEDDSEVIGPAGLEKLCGDADISLEGPLPLLMAWQFRASEMAKVTKSEWESGTSALQ